MTKNVISHSIPLNAITGSLEDEYRMDTLTRLDAVDSVLSQALLESMILNNTALEEICLHIHSIKGTSGTFGFRNLSIATHAMDSSLLSSRPNEGGALLLERLQGFSTLLRRCVQSSDELNESDLESAIKALLSSH